jgi:cell division protein FtsB
LDQTGLVYKSKLKEEIDHLENKKHYYQEEIRKNEVYYKDLRTNPEAKERLAREEYYMSKENEDVFIIREEEPDEE